MKNIKRACAALLAAMLLSSMAYAAEPAVTFDFEKDDAGFTPVFADCPAEDGVDDFYELRHGWAELPMGGGKGLFLSGNNHSDDLFMGYYKELPGLKPGRLYEFHVTFRLATNVDGGMIGVGGSPGASVFVKGGVTVSAISKCRFSPKRNVVFYRAAYRCYTALYTTSLAGLKPVKP